MRMASKIKTVCAAPLAALLLVGCHNAPQTPQQFLAPPATAARVTHYIGTPLSGPTLARPVAFQPGDAFAVDVEFVGLEHMTPEAGQPVAGKARMLIQSRRDYPTMPAERLLRGSRWIDLKDQATLAGEISPVAGRIVEIAKPTGALPSGVTASFTLTDSIGLEDPASDSAIHRQIEIDIYRAANNHLEMGIALADLADLAPEKTDLGESTGKEEKQTPKPSRFAGKAGSLPKPAASKPIITNAPPVFQRELAIVDLPPLSSGGERAAVIIPMLFAGADTTAVAAVLTLTPTSATPEHVAASARCADDLQRSSDAVANSPRALTVISPQWSRYRVALDALTQSDRRRAALVYLAAQTGAPLCRDVALAADEPTLDRLSGEVRRAVASPVSAAPTGEQLGWTLDRTTFKMIATMMNDAKLPLELSAIIADVAGQPGRDAGSMEEVSHSLSTRAQFNTRLQAENLISLEDSSLTARVRAYDWLLARGEAPPGYDPQGTRKDRRAALENFSISSAGAPSTAPAGAAK
jgi:hypothetical protein